MEQLLLIAIFLLVGLVNAIVRWLRQRAQTARPDVEEPQPMPEPVVRPRELPPAARVVLPELPVEAALAAARRPPPPAPLPRRPRSHRRLGSRADIRRAIVTMTVLGPCRAREAEAAAGPPVSVRS